MEATTLNLYLDRAELYDTLEEANDMYISKFGKAMPRNGDDLTKYPKEVRRFAKKIIDAKKNIKDFHESLKKEQKDGLRSFITSMNKHESLLGDSDEIDNNYKRQFRSLSEDEKNGIRKYLDLTETYDAESEDRPYTPAQKFRKDAKDFADPKQFVDYLNKEDPESVYIYRDGKVRGRPKGTNIPTRVLDPSEEYYTNPDVSIKEKAFEAASDLVDVRKEVGEGLAEETAAGYAASASRLLPGIAGKIAPPVAAVLAGGGTSVALDKLGEFAAEQQGISPRKDDATRSFLEGGLTSLLPLGKMGMLEKKVPISPGQISEGYLKGKPKTLENILLKKVEGTAPSRALERSSLEKSRQPVWGGVEAGMRKISAGLTGIPEESFARYAAERDDLLQMKSDGTLDDIGKERLHELQVRLGDITAGMTDASYANILSSIQKGSKAGDTVDLSQAINVLDSEINNFAGKAIDSNNPMYKDRALDIQNLKNKYFPKGTDYSDMDQIQAYDLMRQLTDDLVNFDSKVYDPNNMIGQAVRREISSAFPGYVKKEFKGYSSMANINTAIKRKNLARASGEITDPNLVRTFDRPEYQASGGRDPSIVKDRSKKKSEITYGREKGELPFQSDVLLNKGMRSIGEKETDEILGNILKMEKFLGRAPGPTKEAQDLYKKIQTQKEWMMPKSEGGGFPNERSNWMRTGISMIPAGGAGMYYLGRSAGADPTVAAILSAGTLAASNMLQSPKAHKALLDLSKGAGKSTGTRYKYSGLKSIPMIGASSALSGARGGVRAKAGESIYDTIFDRQPSYEGQ